MLGRQVKAAMEPFLELAPLEDDDEEGKPQVSTRFDKVKGAQVRQRGGTES